MKDAMTGYEVYGYEGNHNHKKAITIFATSPAEVRAMVRKQMPTFVILAIYPKGL